ncbi:hypothetical protein HER32_03425 [Hymenobacter sp. BT18]|uniref:PID-CTERM protein-sorting domain-containing protein n=1 Tax=Hymenobacter TaxID=89966 RepID=UPI00143ECC1F|nr:MULTISPECIES: hypothetical protein [Hymenobacter]QIX60290.1 hypothetical protein HER32_03425 [Hymenobacter sp. BT18]
MLLSVQTAWAQGEPPEGGPEPDSPTDVPIDGGASLLLAAGVGMGLRHLRRGKAQ